jgi:Protein of unknown function (DUF3047)
MPKHTLTLLLTLSSMVLCGCASLEPAEPERGGWHAVHLPGKASTRYAHTTKDGREAIGANADRSASMWRRKVSPAPGGVAEVRFSWWLEQPPDNASVADVQREDAGARVLFAFDGDHARLSPRTRMLFDMAEALTGEKPPFATLMYVWDSSAPVGTVIVNPRSDRIRKIVVDSGPAELRRWRDHRRDLRADFRRAFGEEPGTLVSVAVMTDSDNTASRAQAWYGEVSVHEEGAVGGR